MLKQKPILHLMTTRRIEQFWRKVDRAGDCWLWQGARRADGYGVMKIQFAGQVKVHRIAYVLNTGTDIADDLIVDHLCGNKACVNPAHLEAITQAENVARYHAGRPGSGKCKRGHDKPVGQDCSICSALRQQEWKQRNPARAKAISSKYEAKRSVKRKAELEEFKAWAAGMRAQHPLDAVS